MATIRKITVTSYYGDVSSLNDPLVQPVNYNSSQVKASRAKKRWFLAYTLVHNPELIKLRKRDDVKMINIVDQDTSQSDLI